MKKFIVAILFLSFPLAGIADISDCKFPADMVKRQAPRGETDVATHDWSAGINKDSDEPIKTLRVFYKNGDIAVIQHYYCIVYNFKISYLRNSQATALDAVAIADTIAGLYSQYYSAPKKVKFKKPLKEIILATLKQHKFDVDKDFDFGLPDHDMDYPNEFLSASLKYKTLDPFGSAYSSAVIFYLGIGQPHNAQLTVPRSQDPHVWSSPPG